MARVTIAYVGREGLESKRWVEIDERAIEEMFHGFDAADDRGCLDFQGACERVLELDDSRLKARKLAELAGEALWYANNLRSEGL